MEAQEKKPVTPRSTYSLGNGDFKDIPDDRINVSLYFGSKNLAACKSNQAHTYTPEKALEVLGSNADKGLSSEEARSRLDIYGPNEMDKGKTISLWAIFLKQTVNSMVIVLIIAAAISLAIQDWISGGVIVGVIVINVGVGFFQQLAAERTIADLRTLQTSSAVALRNGEEIELEARDVVPGDIVLIRSGDSVPADARILTTSANFETDEAILTGESLPVQKDASMVCDLDYPTGDRLNMIFASTTVTRGRCTALVVTTGMDTELGKIARALESGDNEDEDDENSQKEHKFKRAVRKAYRFILYVTGLDGDTPLHRRMAALALYLFALAVVLAIVALAAQKFNVTREVAVYAIVVALSMIPASLVVVLTITMAIGAKTMADRHVLVRNLHSLEALGSVNYICSDKTGTLTQGKMEVKKMWDYASKKTWIVEEGQGIDPTTGKILEETTMELVEKGHVKSGHELHKLAGTAALANSAKVRQDEEGNWKADGDPTETALRVFVERLSVSTTDHEHVMEFPFDSSIKRMTALFEHTGSGECWAYTKGAVERLLDLCADVDHDLVISKMESLASQGLRVLAFAHRKVDSEKEDLNDRNAVERDLTFLGLAGIYDPPRQESADAVKRCDEAGISVHMLTGDHPQTAKSIAKQIGILKDETPGSVMTAAEFDALTRAQVDALEALPKVIARCSPTTKVNMIDALHRRGNIVAMTGDGVNDCPSLKRADIGIAMGLNGSDVAKDASDIVLTDDNFASITAGIEEGRRMTSNIQKFTLHLLAGNVAQCLFLVIGLAFQDREGFSVFPLSSVEVLWVIMITASFPAMGLGQQAADADVMRRPPAGKSSKSVLFSIEMITDMVSYGIILTIMCIVTFVGLIYGPYNPNGAKWNLGVGCNRDSSDECTNVFRARSTCFTIMTWSLLFLAWEVVDMRRSMFALHDAPATKEERGGKSVLMWQITHSAKLIYNNQFLFWSVALGTLTVFPIVYIPVINDYVFQHGPISWHWAVAFGATVVFIAGSEGYKWAKRAFIRRKEKKDALTSNPSTNNSRASSIHSSEMV